MNNTFVVLYFPVKITLKKLEENKTHKCVIEYCLPLSAIIEKFRKVTKNWRQKDRRTDRRTDKTVCEQTRTPNRREGRIGV